MSHYIVLHTPIGSPEETAAALSDEKVARFAQANASGQFPAQCLKTWNPMPHGRSEYMFCLWEGDSPEDVRSSIEEAGLSQILTADIMQVSEIDWFQLTREAT